jgi:hypothetical protein
MLAFDEEVDYLEYQHYLQLQSDSELFDIVDHLNFIECPRRAEAARRELSRRRSFSAYQYAESEILWRNFALLALMITALTLLLSLTMSRDEAISPQPPPSLDLTADGSFFQFSNGSDLSDGGQLSAAVLGFYVGQLCQNFLRDAVQTFSRYGLYLAMLAATFWKLSLCYRRRGSDDSLSRDVKRLMTIAATAQIVLLSLSSFTEIPCLVNHGSLVSGGFLARAVALIAPWG